MESGVMTMTDIQYGDKVMLNDKYYVIQSNKDKVFTVTSDPYECHGATVVTLNVSKTGYASFERSILVIVKNPGE